MLEITIWERRRRETLIELSLVPSTQKMRPSKHKYIKGCQIQLYFKIRRREQNAINKFEMFADDARITKPLETSVNRSLKGPLNFARNASLITLFCL